jgi:hypothetical protein
MKPLQDITFFKGLYEKSDIDSAPRQTPDSGKRSQTEIGFSYPVSYQLDMI